MNFEPIALKIYDSIDIIVLPLNPVGGWAEFIGKYPVTNQQYRQYLEDINKTVELEPCGERFVDRFWLGPFYPWRDADFSDPFKPVVCVSYNEAFNYTLWLNKKISQDYRISLTTPGLWDFAAYGRNFFTTNSSDWLNLTDYIHHKADSPLEVNSRLNRTNFQGVSDLIGNVWEWCYTQNESISFITARNEDSSSRLNPEIRGGGFYDDLNFVKPYLNALSIENREYTKHSDLGFRISGKINTQLLSLSDRKKIQEFNANIATIAKFHGLNHSITTPLYDKKVAKIKNRVAKIDEIKGFIARSQLDKALKLLKSLEGEDLKIMKNEIILLESRVSHLEAESRKGILEYTKKIEIQNGIVDSVLKLIDDIELGGDLI